MLVEDSGSHPIPGPLPSQTVTRLNSCFPSDCDFARNTTGRQARIGRCLADLPPSGYQAAANTVPSSRMQSICRSSPLLAFIMHVLLSIAWQVVLSAQYKYPPHSLHSAPSPSPRLTPALSNDHHHRAPLTSKLTPSRYAEINQLAQGLLERAVLVVQAPLACTTCQTPLFGRT